MQKTSKNLSVVDLEKLLLTRKSQVDGLIKRKEKLKKARLGHEIIIFEHFHDLAGPKYAEKCEDSDFDIKRIHFPAKMP